MVFSCSYRKYRENARARRQKEADLLYGLFSISLKPEAVKFRMCDTVCGLLLISHIFLNMMQKISKGLKISCGAENYRSSTTCLST